MKAIANGIVEGIALAKTQKYDATKTISKWFYSNDREVFDEVYREVTEKNLPQNLTQRPLGSNFF